MSFKVSEIIAQHDAVLILYGAPSCRVCGDIKQPLFDAITRAYPMMQTLYINCQDDQETCAQRGVFSVPVVQVYLQGQKYIEKGRVFSIAALVDELARPIQLMMG